MQTWKTLVLLVFWSLNLHGADSSAIAAKIIDKVVVSFFPDTKIYAWGENTEHAQIIRNSSRMEFSSTPSRAYFILVSKKIPENLHEDTIIFTTEYDLLAKDQRVVGAFFWQKGRPNLLFLRDRLQSSNLKLGREFDKYIEDEL